MADKEIGDLTAASALTGTETVHVVQGGNSRRTTTQGIADLAAGGATSLDDLTDVDLSAGVNDGDTLIYEASSQKFYPGPNASTTAFRGALVKNNSDLTAFNASAGDTLITWADEVYDTSSFHSTVTNTSRLTVPADVSYVRLTANLHLDLLGGGTDIIMHLRKNGSNLSDGGFHIGNDALANFGTLFGVSGVLAVAENDYFEVTLFVNGDSSVTVVSDSFFQMEVIQ